MLWTATSLNLRPWNWICQILHSYAGIPWYLSVRRNLVDGVEYLGIYLSYSIIDNHNWSLVVTYELRLLNSGPVGVDVVRINSDRQFKKPDSFTGWGFKKFITVDQLRAGSFIQNDTIKIRAHLSTKSFERMPITAVKQRV